MPNLLRKTVKSKEILGEQVGKVEGRKSGEERRKRRGKERERTIISLIFAKNWHYQKSHAGHTLHPV